MSDMKISDFAPSHKSVTLRIGCVSGDIVDEIRAIAQLRGVSMHEELRRIVRAGLAVERRTQVGQ
jgi:uncharacterized protein YhbP (UPF0306 family)